MKKKNKTIKDYWYYNNKKKTSYKLFGIGIIGIIIMSIFCLLTSCGTYKMTEKERQINYKLDKLYTEYMYQRDSLIIEYNKK
jgi:hypothetical protein